MVKTVQISLALHRMKEHLQIPRTFTGHIFGPWIPVAEKHLFLGRWGVFSFHATARPRPRL